MKSPNLAAAVTQLFVLSAIQLLLFANYVDPSCLAGILALNACHGAVFPNVSISLKFLPPFQFHRVIRVNQSIELFSKVERALTALFELQCLKSEWRL
jgi:hypothetical protein